MSVSILLISVVFAVSVQAAEPMTPTAKLRTLKLRMEGVPPSIAEYE